MRRRLLIISGCLLASTLLVLGTVPLWLGVALDRIAGCHGVTFTGYERIGYTRFALEGLAYTHPSVRVEVTRVEAPTPVLWAWRHWRGQGSDLVAGTWSAEVLPRQSRPSEPAAGWMPLRARLSRIVSTLDRWLPSARAEAGTVRWPGGRLQVGPAEWGGRVLKVSAIVHDQVRAEALMDWSAANDELLVSLASADGDWRVVGRSREATMNADVTWWEQPARIQARFDPEGWLPAEAGLTAAGWRLDGGRLRIGDRYRTIAGDAEFSWRDDRLEVALTANGEPVPGQEVPPLAVVLRGHGNAQAFTVEELEVNMPGVRASLDAPVEMNPSEGFRPVRSRFTLAADLAELPWAGLRGRVAGEAEVLPGTQPWPVVEASLELEGVGRDAWELTSAAVRARLEWPRLLLTEASLATGGGGRLNLTGAWNFTARELADTELSGRVTHADLSRWLPEGIALDEAVVTARAAGIWPDIRHEGRLDAAELRLAPIKPFALAGTWHGLGTTLETLELTARAGGASLTAAGTLEPGEVRLTQLVLESAAGRRMDLEAPARIRWTPSPLVENLVLTGDDARLDLNLQTGASGRIALEARSMDSLWARDWFDLPGPDWQLDELDLAGDWDEGPMTFALGADVVMELGEERAARVALAARGDADGIRIESLRAVEASIAILGATGRLPVTLWPAAAPRLRIDGDGVIALALSSEPHPSFWRQFAGLTGIRLEEPHLSAGLEGTWSRPRGSLHLSAQSLSLEDGRWLRTLPEVSGLELRLAGDGDGVSLEEFRVSVAGQALRARGRLPFVPAQWAEIRDDPLAFLEQGADLRIEIPDADLAELSRYVPEYLAPAGRLQLDVGMRPGGALEGRIRLQDAVSRPLGPLGILQEIGADIRLEGRQVVLAAVSARTGGQLVTLSGTLGLPRGGEPQLDLALRGDNLPFVRQSGLLMRGDLDLKLVTRDGGETLISGTARLRDSLFLADLLSFIPRGGRAAGPARRPPYFAIEAEPLNAWLLDVDVQGERFLRLRTGVFNGTASARFRLGGTLGDPRATGEAVINEGQVLLPFATFSVQQGSVRLNEADPYEPQLLLNATARRHGHDVRLELSGTASNPALAFTSSPPLESEQILLMVMAGEPPGDETAYGAGQRAVRLGAYLGRSLINSFGGDPGRAERLNLTLGEKVSRQGRETYGIEYRIDSRWSLVGEYDEFDEFNAGVKWRLRAREETDAN